MPAMLKVKNECSAAQWRDYLGWVWIMYVYIYVYHV